MSESQQNSVSSCSCPVCRGQCPRCRMSGCGMCNRCMHARCPLCPTCAKNIERYEDTGTLNQEQPQVTPQVTSQVQDLQMGQGEQGAGISDGQNKIVPVKKHKKIITFDRILLVLILILLIYMLFVRNRL